MVIYHNEWIMFKLYGIEWSITKVNWITVGITVILNGSPLNVRPQIEFWTTLKEPGIDQGLIQSARIKWAHHGGEIVGTIQKCITGCVDTT